MAHAIVDGVKADGLVTFSIQKFCEMDRPGAVVRTSFPRNRVVSQPIHCSIGFLEGDPMIDKFADSTSCARFRFSSILQLLRRF